MTKTKQKYSAAEQALLDLLPKNGGTITTKQLISKRYGRNVPFNAASNIRATLRILSEKIKFNKEPFVIKRTGQVGPHSQEIWLEKR